MIRTVLGDDEPLVRERLRTLLAAHRDAELVAECGDGLECVDTILRIRPDLVFLDIRMPELSGLEVLEALPADRRPAVVFVTAYDEFAVRGFEVNAVDYLLKPVEPRRFDEALDRVRDRLARPAAARLAGVETLLSDLQRTRGYVTRLVARKGNAIVFVPVAEIDWIDARGNYARLHQSGSTHLIREPLRELVSRLDPERFLRIHRSTIVNLERVASIEPYFHGEYVVTLRDGTKLTSSRTRSAALRALIR